VAWAVEEDEAAVDEVVDETTLASDPRSDPNML